MKNPGLYLSFLALPLLFSCNQTEQKSAELKDSAIHKECFISIDGKDTANLELETFEGGKITGNLLINYIDKGKNEGVVAGAYKGDTLFVDFTFKIGTENKTMYKNPLAFLKKDGKLILGVGQIETSMGKSYFVKGKPIDFEKGRFTFDSTVCKE
ncbi:MAG: hypothetical protein WC623_19315 [Pedobacter sp.]|uniref:hypothetical protein n=1 Tax=Pedobacter sp. TaxID=1411316 RepID=UPI0035678DB0